MIEVEIRVQGIPARAEVTHARAGRPAHMGTHDPRTGDLVDPGHPPEGDELDYTILDRRGYRAPWLERLADSDRDAVDAQVWQQLERECQRDD